MSEHDDCFALIKERERDIERLRFEAEGMVALQREQLDEIRRLRAEVEAYRRAKRENDERFQLQAAEWREKYERLRALLDPDNDRAVQATGSQIRDNEHREPWDAARAVLAALREAGTIT